MEGELEIKTMQSEIETLKNLKNQFTRVKAESKYRRSDETVAAHAKRVRGYDEDVQNCDIAILLLEYIEILDRVIDSSDTLGRRENYRELCTAADAKQAAIAAVKRGKAKNHTNMSDKELRCLRLSACITVNALAPTVFQFQF